MKEDKMMRVGDKFRKEIQDIQNNRLKSGVDTNKTSSSDITSLMIKHISWKKIKEDLTIAKRGLFFDIRGIATSQLFYFIFVCFIGLILLGTCLLSFVFINNAFVVQNVTMIGNDTLAGYNSHSFGLVVTAFEDKADYLGFAIIFGTIIGMFLNAYFFFQGFPKLFIILDIIILVGATYFSYYISQAYSLFINSNAMIFSIYSNYMPQSSAFMLDLPYYTGIIGIAIMILTYAMINKKENLGRVGNAY